MKRERFFLVLGIMASAIAAMSSCKKDEPVVTKLTLFGEMKVSMEPYVTKGQEIVLHPSIVTKLDLSKEVGYFWTVTAFSIRDTTRYEKDPVDFNPDFTFVVPDTLCTFNVNQNAFADDYNNKSASASATIVDSSLDGTGSITGFRFSPQDKLFEDGRDLKMYLAHKIGNLYWMRTNLRYEGSGHPYGDHHLMAEVFGQLYSWNEAQEVCPPGWRLPSESDWVDLAKAAGCESASEGVRFEGCAGDLMLDCKFNGDRMWEFWPEVPITDALYFSAISVGYAQRGGDHYTYSGCKDYALFWTADSDGEDGMARYIYKKQNIVHIGLFDKNTVYAPVRCVCDQL